MGRIKVSIITGFLGSGKTTLLAEILAGYKDEGLAVIVNELGVVGLDNTILNASFVKEKTMLLNSGCACCNRRSDLIDKLREILDAYELSSKSLDRVIIETTGLANPAPILWTILSDAFLSNHFEIAQLITCVDALNGLEHIKNNTEAINQIVASDCVVITKSDLNSDLSELRGEILKIYGGVRIYDKFALSFDRLFEIEHRESFGEFSRAQGFHNDSVSSVCVELRGVVEWNAFSIWLSLLLHKYGQDMLRVKGLIDTGSDYLVSINSVCHIVHPPSHIKKTESSKESPKIVFIAKNLDLSLVVNSLKIFLSSPDLKIIEV